MLLMLLTKVPVKLRFAKNDTPGTKGLLCHARFHTDPVSNFASTRQKIWEEIHHLI